MQFNKFLIIICLFSSAIVQGQTVKGFVTDGPRKEVIAFASVKLIDAAQAFVTTSTDLEGEFRFYKVSPGIYSIGITYVGYPDIIYNNIRIQRDTTIKLDIHRYCKYDETLKNKTCPVCHKSNKVVPILYGLLISKNGSSPMTDEPKRFKAGGCMVTGCDPNWYCKRDKTEF